MKIREFFELLWLNFQVTVKGLIEFFRVAFRYYSNISFLKCDISLYLMYLFHNPFSISKRFLRDKGVKDIYAYGETPLTSLEIIAKESRIRKEDKVYELGCGRGRTCFWLNCFIGCPVVGIEHIPEFVERANRISKKLGMNAVSFRAEEMEDANITDANVIYLYGTCLDDETIEKMALKFALLPKGTKIITTSYPLTDYSDAFQVMKRFTVPFTWGLGDVYLQIVK